MEATTKVHTCGGSIEGGSASASWKAVCALPAGHSGEHNAHVDRGGYAWGSPAPEAPPRWRSPASIAIDETGGGKATRHPVAAALAEGVVRGAKAMAEQTAREVEEIAGLIPLVRGKAIDDVAAKLTALAARLREAAR
jgi:hypothetical protein